MEEIFFGIPYTDNIYHFADRRRLIPFDHFINQSPKQKVFNRRAEAIIDFTSLPLDRQKGIKVHFVYVAKFILSKTVISREKRPTDADHSACMMDLQS